MFWKRSRKNVSCEVLMQLTGSISQTTNYEAKNCSPLQFYDEGLPCSPGFRLQPVAICRKVT